MPSVDDMRPFSCLTYSFFTLCMCFSFPVQWWDEHGCYSTSCVVSGINRALGVRVNVPWMEVSHPNLWTLLMIFQDHLTDSEASCLNNLRSSCLVMILHAFTGCAHLSVCLFRAFMLELVLDLVWVCTHAWMRKLWIANIGCPTDQCPNNVIVACLLIGSYHHLHLEILVCDSWLQCTLEHIPWSMGSKA